MAFLAKFLALFAALAFAVVPLAAGELSESTKQLAAEWAPLIWLHSEDPYYPSSIDYHMDNMELRDENEMVVMESPTPTTIPVGPDSSTLHLNTYDDLECVRCTVPHFSGQALADTPVYVLVVEHKDECDTIDISYRTFYPYNWGKDVCVGIEVNGKCLGFIKTFGNHVVDWEGPTIRFQHGIPTDIDVPVHSFGAKYAFNKETNEFDFYYGEPLKEKVRTEKGEKIDIDVPVSYPEKVVLKEGNHPEIFSANGSHGSWSEEGRHVYFQLVIHLDDFCERGEAWRTWEHMEFIDFSDPDVSFEGTDQHWLDFEGRMGNIEKQGCEFDPLFGVCGLGSAGGVPGRPTSFENPPVCEPL